MSYENELPVQLYGTSVLCFNKDDFMKEGFSVDNFVRIHQSAGHGGLETLRDNLGVYLKILRSAMIELINRDYADFVNLSTNLTGLDRLIEALKTPLGQLREEVLNVKKILDEAITTTSQDLGLRQEITSQKALLHRLQQISYRLDRLEALLKSGSKDLVGPECPKNGDPISEGGDLVDRLAAEVNHLNFLVSHCEGAALIQVFKPRVKEICQFVEIGLERGLREGVINKDASILCRTLRTYASLGSVNHAHSLVRELLRKSLEEVISDAALRSDPRGLSGMYFNTLSAINEVCQMLLAVTTGHGSEIIRGYSFLECSAWPEVVSALETNTQHIFNPGNPTLFHQRYLETIEFIGAFESLIGMQERVLKFRELPEYNTFMDRWNLPVYFQIRYQEIGQVVECAFCREGGFSSAASSSSISVASVPANFNFASSQTVWESLLHCYSSEIYLPPLLHRFWKLTLLILSRYKNWVETTTEKMKNSSTQSVLPKDASSNLLPAKPKDKLHSPVQKMSNITSDQNKPNNQSVYTVDHAVDLVQDLQLLANILPSLFDHAIKQQIEHLPHEKFTIIKDELQNQCLKLSELTKGLSEVVIQSIMVNASSSLRHVGDTPRLYRRTNRAPPTTHQPYIAVTTAVLTSFATKNCDRMNKNVLINWLTRVCSEIAEQYKSLIYDVLSSVHKMEESLKRLKRARDRGGLVGSDSSGILSDDDKIRLQIFLDVEYFGQQVNSISLDATKMESYQSLLKMARDAKDGKFIP